MGDATISTGTDYTGFQIYSNSGTSSSNHLQMYTSGSYGKAGNVITGDGKNIGKIIASLRRAGSGPTNMRAEVFATSGGVPTGSPVATSTQRPGTDATTAGTTATVEFLFDGTYELQTGVDYWVGVAIVGTNSSGNSLYLSKNVGALTGYAAVGTATTPNTALGGSDTYHLVVEEGNIEYESTSKVYLTDASDVKKIKHI